MILKRRPGLTQCRHASRPHKGPLSTEWHRPFPDARHTDSSTTAPSPVRLTCYTSARCWCRTAPVALRRTTAQAPHRSACRRCRRCSGAAAVRRRRCRSCAAPAARPAAAAAPPPRLALPRCWWQTREAIQVRGPQWLPPPLLRPLREDVPRQPAPARTRKGRGQRARRVQYGLSTLSATVRSAARPHDRTCACRCLASLTRYACTGVGRSIRCCRHAACEHASVVCTSPGFMKDTQL
jgi:hypothetical protein